MRTATKFAAPLAAAAVLIAAGSAHAGIPIPDLTLTYTVGATTQNPDPNGSIGETGFQYVGSASISNVSFNWDILASGSGIFPLGARTNTAYANIMNNLVVTNNSLTTTQTVIATVTLPIGPLGPSTLNTGSASGTVTANNNAGALSTSVANNPFYRALIDGLGFVGGDLFIAPQNIAVAAFGSNTTGAASFGGPKPSIPGGAILNTIGIRLEFRLTPGESVSWTSGFAVDIPSPGGAALLAVAGAPLAARRRRR